MNKTLHVTFRFGVYIVYFSQRTKKTISPRISETKKEKRDRNVAMVCTNRKNIEVILCHFVLLQGDSTALVDLTCRRQPSLHL
jgi:hypothetical protein